MAAVHFIAEALLQYLLVTAFLLRVLLPLSRANMRNPLAQAVLRVTSPVVMPLRKILPPVGRVDTASIVALILVQLATVLILRLLEPRGFGPAELIAIDVVFALLYSILGFYSFAIFIYVLLGWVAPATYSPASDLLGTLVEPILRPMRRLIPPIGGLDLSPVFVLIGIQAVQRFALPSLYNQIANAFI